MGVLAGKGEAQTGAVAVTAFASNGSASKPLENPLTLTGRYSWPMVFDCNDDRVGSSRDLDPCDTAAVKLSIVDQVAEDPFEASHVAAHDRSECCRSDLQDAFAMAYPLQDVFDRFNRPHLFELGLDRTPIVLGDFYKVDQGLVEPLHVGGK